jgi:hypothetical protein
MIGITHMGKECMKISAFKQKWTHNTPILARMKGGLKGYVSVQILSNYERQ